MGADFQSSRNKGYRRATIVGTLLFLLLVLIVLGLLCWLLPRKVILCLLVAIAVLVLLFLAAGVLFPLPADRILSSQSDKSIDPLDRRILRMALSDEVSQDDLEGFLKDWDIEKAPIKSVMLVAYMMKTRRDLHFPSSIRPRLEGVLTFCRFQNLKREAHFNRVGAALNEVGIPFLILKGGAMKVYRPDFPRWMNDIDVLVPSSDYEHVLDMVIGLGYDKLMCTDHSADLRLPGSEEGLLDIHRHLEMFTGKEEALNDGLFSRASSVPVFSTRGLLPCPEDMVFVALVNLYKNLANNQTPESSLTTFYDIKFLLGLKDSFDWGIVLDNAAKSDAGFQLYYAATIMSKVLPGLLPIDMLRPRGMDDKEFGKRMIDFIFRRDVLSSARDSVMSTELGSSLQRNYNPLVFLWIGAVSVLKYIFRSTATKRAFLTFKYSFEK